MNNLSLDFVPFSYWLHYYIITCAQKRTLHCQNLAIQMSTLPLFIQTFLRNFVGMLTKNFLESAASTSWRLFPRPLVTCQHTRQERTITEYTLVPPSLKTGNGTLTRTISWSPVGSTNSSSTSLVTYFLFVAFDMSAESWPPHTARNFWLDRR